MAILKNSVIVAFWTGMSRILGFARDLVIANKLGAGMAADAFFVALMLPNLFRRLFAEGAFNVAFVPIVARHKGKSDAAAMEFAHAVFSWLIVVVAGVTLVGVLAMPLLVGILASGWLDQPEKFALAVELGRMTFPYLGLITIASFLGAMCNTFGKFAAFAMVPALLNISILVCLFTLPWAGAHPAEAAAMAVPLGGIAQAAYMLWAARRLGLRFRIAWLPKHADLKTLLLRMGPAAVGVGVLQLSLIVDNQVASYLQSGAVSYLQYANRFYQLPMALIGIAVATVLLPHLSVLLGKGDRAGAALSFTRALSGCLTLAVGATVGLLVLAPELMQVTLRHGEFSDFAAQATAWAMMGYVIGLPAYIVSKVTAPAFFANEDPMSPVKAGGYALLVNFVLNVLFVVLAMRYGYENIAHVGIAVATAIGGYVNAGLQWKWLKSKGVLVIDRGALWADCVRMMGVGVVLAGVLLGMKVVVPYLPEAALVVRMAWLGGVMAVGLVVFAVMVQGVGLLRWGDYLRKKGVQGV
ncbi:MAG: murein biosynthesis integral membrane protein MurJ [Proteobacteria bacterium]|nr:murein biosynthesis integral membrane protein MurJ [Pseudomonadota bacterium]